jgi:hypothetical protein
MSVHRLRNGRWLLLLLVMMNEWMSDARVT